MINKNANVNENINDNKKTQHSWFWLLLALMLVMYGCGAAPEAEETMQTQLQEGMVQAENPDGDIKEDDTEKDAAEEGDVEKDDTEKDAAEEGDVEKDDTESDGASRRDDAENNVAEDKNAETDYLNMDAEEREELISQLLDDNNMDTAIVKSSRTTGGCTFELPEGFEESENMPGMYVNEHYPVDAATIYYAEKDKDSSLQLMTEKTFTRNTEKELEQVYGAEVEIEIKSFEKIKISGYPAFRILYSYAQEDMTITQLEYIINADKSYVIIYSQTDEYDRMEEFEASADTIQIKFS